MNHSPSGHFVVVYGTLKRGHSNHHWLAGATFLGRRLLSGGRLHDLGPYPMAVLSRDPQAVIHGELFAVTEEGLVVWISRRDTPPSMTAACGASVRAKGSGTITAYRSRWGTHPR